MDPVTIASGVAAVSGLGLAWRMYRRASRAEAEAAHLRGALRRCAPTPTRGPLPNQRPWRLTTGGPRPRPRPP
jgi:hypothetical protein